MSTSRPPTGLAQPRRDPVTPLRLGFTFELRSDFEGRGLTREELAEYEAPETVEALCSTFAELGHTVDRIGGLAALTGRLVRGDHWDLVFNICEGERGYGREAAVPALLDAYDIPYTFSDPLALAVTLHKATAKCVVQAQGVPTPAFHVVASLEDLDELSLPWPVFCKPVAEGSSKGVHRNSMARNRTELSQVCTQLLEAFRQPVLVEQYLPGREFTVGIIGTGRAAEALGATEITTLQPGDHDYTFEIKNVDWIGKIDYRLAEGDVAREACEVALQAWRAVGGRDCGRVDVRCDAGGRINFIEVNPIPGLRPDYSDICVLCKSLGIEYRELIGRILASACERLPQHSRNRPAAQRQYG